MSRHPQPRYRATARRLTIFYTACIVWGSLYPFEFIWPDHALLAHRLARATSHHMTRGDMVTNVLFYIPLGALCFLAVGGQKRSTRAAFAVIIGSLLSMSMELSQLVTVHRVTSVLDWSLNTVGTIAGAIATALYLSMGDRWRFDSVLGSRPALIPASLIIMWLVTQLAPYAPILTIAQIRDALGTLNDAEPAPISDWSVVLASWWILALAALNIWRREVAPWALLTLMLVTLLGRSIIIDQHESAAEIYSCCAVLACFAVSARTPVLRIWLGAFGCVAALLLSGLWPYDLAPIAGQFHWVPFSGNLLLTRDYRPLLDKIFLYSALLWVLTLSFGRLFYAFAASLVLTTAIEVQQLWMPDRRAEITDPLLIVLLAGAFAISRRFQAHAFGTQGTVLASDPSNAPNN